MSLYTINGVELDIDLNDYDFQKKYEEAFLKMGEEQLSLKKTGSNSELTKAYCDLFYNLFDRIFGEGTGDKLFCGKRNIAVTDSVYTQFIDICTQQAKEAAERRSEMLCRLKPDKSRNAKNTAAF